MMVKDVIGILTAIVVIAGIVAMIRPGNASGTSAVLKSATDGFATDIKAATGQ
ncbi:MAG: hypothetical protein ACRDUW_06510 [Pseudonocardiaceae bacterium]